MAAIRIILIAWLFSFCAPFYAANTNTNVLAIFIAHSVPGPGLMGKPFDRGAVKLADQPLLADGDFVNYDRKTHRFWVTADAARRAAKQLNPKNPITAANGPSVYAMEINSASGRPFAVLIRGEIIYIGVLINPTSSLSSYPLPSIPMNQEIPSDSNAAVNFRIRPVQGEMPSFVTDVRADPRIMGALKKLGL